MIVCLVQGFARNQFTSDYRNALLAGLSIIIASVPEALPLILKITMAMGASSMAKTHGAVVTHMSALQDIAAMEVVHNIANYISDKPNILQ